MDYCNSMEIYSLTNQEIFSKIKELEDELSRCDSEDYEYYDDQIQNLKDELEVRGVDYDEFVES